MFKHARRHQAGAIAALAFLCAAPFYTHAQQSLPPGSAAQARGQDSIQLTLPQVRQLAVDAIKRKDARLARDLAMGLLQADPKSSFAHFTLAHAQGQLGQTAAARKSAAKAYRYADTKLHRFEAAELAARLSYADARPTTTQLWLRRAVQNAPSPEVEAQLARDYGAVRAQNKLSFSIRGGLRPSNNINNGANSAVQIIDGLPFTGTLSGTARALSGTIGSVDASLGYRLRGTKDSRTTLGARLYVQRVSLSEEAKELAGTASSADFGSTYGEVSLRHVFALGEDRNTASLGAALGQFWSGDRKSYSFARLNAGRDWQIAPRTRFLLGGSVEHRASDVRSLFDSTIYGLNGRLQHVLENGDRLSFGVNLRRTQSDFVNTDNTTATVTARYSFGKRIGPAQVSASIAASFADYDDFIAVFRVPGGRQDTSVYANLNLFFPDLDYAGFAPTVTFTAGRKTSNISRYETRELSVSLGIQSKF